MKTSVCLALYFALTVGRVYGAFLDSGSTARTAALGGSYVAVADDAAALTINPAGLGQLQRSEVVADYSRPYTGLSDGSKVAQFYLGYAYPLAIGGSLAMGWKELDFAGLYKERTLSMGYGRFITSRWAAGFSLKQLHHSYDAPAQIVDDSGNIQVGTPDLFAQNGTSQDAYSADLGLLFSISSKSRLGISIQDINEPNIALSSTDRDIVARTIRVGLASELRPGLTAAAGIQTRQSLTDQRDWVGSGSLERWFKETDSTQFGLRGSFAAGSRVYRQVETGASYRVHAFQVDYAFALNFSGITLGDTFGTHRLSIAYRFGKEPLKGSPINLSSVDANNLASLMGLDKPIPSLSLTEADGRNYFPRSIELTLIALDSDPRPPVELEIIVLSSDLEPQLASNRISPAVSY